MLSTQKYPIKSWSRKYPTSVVSLKILKIHSTWRTFIKNEMDKPYWTALEDRLTRTITAEHDIYPYPFLVFRPFNKTPFNKIKVVFIGQDPYFSNEVHNKLIPQAMGLCFSVPQGIKIPSSLKNIFKNQLKYNIIDNLPTHGNLRNWAKQGCLLMNASLTVKHNKKNSHAKYWKKFTDNTIKHISDNKTNIVFVLWGSFALSKLDLIDQTKHKVIISSHPSGLSCNSRLRQYDSFNNTDHFGEINKHLVDHNMTPINWTI